MVKNTKGGSGAKKMGRKFGGGGGSSANRALRLVVDEDEMYAAVTKIFGNGMCEVMCNDSKTRLGIIRINFADEVSATIQLPLVHGSWWV